MRAGEGRRRFMCPAGHPTAEEMQLPTGRDQVQTPQGDTHTCTHTPCSHHPTLSLPQSQATTNFCLYELASAEHLIWMKWYNMWPCCLASLLNMFPRFIHTGACVATPLLFYGRVILHHMGIAYFVYWFLHWWKFELFLPFGYHEWCFYEHLYTLFL